MYNFYFHLILLHLTDSRKFFQDDDCSKINDKTFRSLLPRKNESASFQTSDTWHPVIFRDESASQIVKRFRKVRVSDSKERESARSNQQRSENGYAALGRLDAMIMGLRYWERLGSTMTGGSANRLMASARRDAITVHAGLSVTLVCSSLTKSAMIAVIAPNCLMAGKWMIIVLERHEELPSRHGFFVIRLTDLYVRFALERRKKERGGTRVPFARSAGIATGAWIRFYPVPVTRISSFAFIMIFL